jgi:phasin family protein
MAKKYEAPTATPAETTTAETNVIEMAPAAAEAATEAATTDVTATVSKAIAALQDGISGATANFQKTQTEVKANMDKAIKSAEELVSFSQGNLEAVVKSGQIWAAGVQDFSKFFAAAAQAQMDETMATFKAFTSVKSLKEAIDLQQAAARSAVEKAVTEASKITDASVKLTEQALAPIAARVTLAVEKFGRIAA